MYEGRCLIPHLYPDTGNNSASTNCDKMVLWPLLHWKLQLDPFTHFIQISGEPPDDTESCTDLQFDGFIPHMGLGALVRA